MLRHSIFQPNVPLLGTENNKTEIEKINLPNVLPIISLWRVAYRFIWGLYIFLEGYEHNWSFPVSALLSLEASSLNRLKYIQDDNLKLEAMKALFRNENGIYQLIYIRTATVMIFWNTLSYFLKKTPQWFVCNFKDHLTLKRMLAVREKKQLKCRKRHHSIRGERHSDLFLTISFGK